MKKKLVLVTLCFSLSLFSAQAAHASIKLKAKCPNELGKLKKCFVYLNDSSISVEFKNKKNEKLNQTINGDHIIKVTQDKINKTRIAEAILISPLFLLSDRKFYNFDIQYKEDDQRKSFNLLIKRKFASQLRSHLEKISEEDVMWSGVLQADVDVNKKDKKKEETQSDETNNDDDY